MDERPLSASPETISHPDSITPLSWRPPSQRFTGMELGMSSVNDESVAERLLRPYINPYLGEKTDVLPLYTFHTKLLAYFLNAA